MTEILKTDNNHDNVVEARYRGVFENTKDGIVVYKAVQDGEDFEFLDLNRAAEKIEHVKRDEIIGKRVTEVFPGVIKFGILEAFKRVYRSGEREFFPVAFYKDDRISGWRENSIYKLPSGELVAIYSDETGRKQSEKAFNAILESTVGITGQDFFDKIVKELSGWLECEIALTGEIVHNNMIKAVAMVVDGQPTSYFSYSLEQSPCHCVIHNGFTVFPEGVCRLYPENKILRKMKAEGYVGTPLKARDGSPIGILAAISRSRLILPDRADHVINILAARASAEIERLRIEEEKKKIETQLYQAQKMEAIGTLAGGIAHDFNNILQSIMLNAELALMEQKPEGMAYYRMENVLRSAKRATDLVKQILLFSRQSEIELKPLQINLIVKEAVKMLRSSIPTTIDIGQDISQGWELVMADPTRLHQIIMNLATNAAHAMREKGGTLSFVLKPVDIKDDKPGNCPDLKPGPYMMIQVIDTGHGIDPSIMARIFDPFFTTKERGEGTGLGLAVALGVVKDLGGAIAVESEVGKGSTFSVYLPRIEKTVPSMVEKIKPLQKGREVILLVDDEKSLVDAHAEAFGKLGYQVVSRYSSMDALEAFRAQPGKFDLVITDQTMPKMTGLQLAREMIGIRPDIPIILCTGFSDLAAEEEARIIGIKKFIMKPVILRELSEVVRDVLDNACS
ncbi:MAG: response regulator [Deltaproteobacteria bacterium]|nr:response regulator [Deltaproteobacteria bacterium]